MVAQLLMCLALGSWVPFPALGAIILLQLSNKFEELTILTRIQILSNFHTPKIGNKIKASNAYKRLKIFPLQNKCV